MGYTYSNTCHCGTQQFGMKTLAEAKKLAKAHIKEKKHKGKPDNNAGKWVFIDQYDESAGELSGKYWKV